jgi:hypothetical protein
VAGQGKAEAARGGGYENPGHDLGVVRRRSDAG